MKYIITNEEFYVKRDHARNKYVRDNRKSEATQFTSKQAKHILGLKHKYTWMKDGFHADLPIREMVIKNRISCQRN